MQRCLRLCIHPLVLFSLLFPSVMAHAQDGGTTAKAQQLFALMHMEATYDQLMQQLLAQTQKTTVSLFPTGTMNDAQKREYAAFMARVDAAIADSFSWKVLEPEFAKLYASNFSDSELDGILAFYRSPVGQAMIAKTPALMSAASAISMQHVQALEPQLRQMMTDEITTMTALGKPASQGGASSGEPH